MIPIVILCGGLATRLYPTTKTIPKSLIMIDGTPFISFQLDLLHKKGITDIILCVGKFGKMIEDYVGNGSFWGLNVKYSYEDENNLFGTGGALKNALHLLPEDFMVTWGDSYLDIDYKHAISNYYKGKNPMLITIFRNKNIGDKSNILYKNDKILNYSKVNPTTDMEHIDYGLIILNKSVFNNYKKLKFDLSDVMTDFISANKVSAFEVNVPFYEIGSKEGIKQFTIKQNSLYI